jgi:phosphatidylglycerophosphate synthase
VAIALLFFSFLSTYARAAAFEKQVFTDLKGGILEHTDRLLFFVAILVAASVSLQYASYLVAGMAVLAAVSAAQRFYKAVKG